MSSSKEVTIYHTPGCGRCQVAADFFREKGFVVSMPDVAHDFGALRRMVKRSGGVRTVPVIELGEEVFVGFDAGYWRQRLKEQS